MLLALAVLWGSWFFFFKVLVAALPPFTVVLARVGIAALLLNAWLAIRRDFMPTSARTWAAYVAMGLLNTSSHSPATGGLADLMIGPGCATGVGRGGVFSAAAVDIGMGKGAGSQFSCAGSSSGLVTREKMQVLQYGKDGKHAPV